MADSHEKIDAAEKITDTHRTQSKAEDKKTENTGKRYDPASLRANMATGGGTPIPKGHKRTTEKRVMQPRDPDTGHFTYNADAELSLKYKSHGKGNADPVALRRMTLNGDIKKGDVVNWGGSTFIAIEDIDARKIKDFLRHYDPETDEFYSYGTDGIDFNAMGKAQQVREGFTEINGKVLANKLSDLFVKKQGRMAKSEKEGIEKGEKRVVGHVDLEKVGDKTKKEVASKLASYNAGFYPKWQADSIMAPSLDQQQLAKNQAFNKNASSFGGGKSQTAQPMAATPTGGAPKQASANPQPNANPAAAPKQEGQSQQTKPDITLPAGTPESMVTDGHIDKDKVDYNKPEQKKFYDGFAAELMRNPAKYGFPATAKITGQQLAAIAKKGFFDKVKL